MSLFIARIPREMRARELEDIFSKFGKITRFDIKQGYGFIDYENKTDAEDAMNEVKHAAFIVEWARNGGRRPGASKCFHCDEEGHWARDCSKAPSREQRSSSGYSRHDGGRGYDRERRYTRDRDSDRRRDDRRRDRSPRRNEYRDRRDGDKRGDDRRDNDRRRDDRRDDDRRDRRDHKDVRRDEDLAPQRDQ